jgi:hypothetical protein
MPASVKPAMAAPDVRKSAADLQQPEADRTGLTSTGHFWEVRFNMAE